MKTLYIVRHAKSSWDDPQLDDFDRPLNNRGKQNAPEMGKHLFKLGVHPDQIISSSAKRAFTTAKKIAKELHYDLNNIVKTRDLYLASVGTSVKTIRKVEDSVGSLMIFGHNPGWTDLSNYLTNAYIDNVPTCGAVAIEFDIDKWADVDKGMGKLLFFEYPKKI